MATLSNSASEFFLSPPCPQALRDWIEQDLGWEALDLREIAVKFQDLEGKYEKYGVLAEAFVTREYLGAHEEKSHQFLQFRNGEWHKFKGWMESDNIVFPVTDWEICYTAELPPNTTIDIYPPLDCKIIKKQELNDNDAFDLMDSIRDELWK